MKKGFKDPIHPTSKTPPCKPEDGKDSSWDYRAPQYDQRHSCFVNAGTDYGVGFNQPVGTHQPSKTSPIPMGKVDTMSVDPHPLHTRNSSGY